jgi:COMM domain containing 3
MLSTTTFNFPHIVDVDWRLDFYIRNNSVDKINHPEYLIKFHTLESHSADDEEANESGLKKGEVQFACSATELLALYKKLQDAVKQFERITGSA